MSPNDKSKSGNGARNDSARVVQKLSANLPEPNVLAQEIADDLQAALAQIQDILGDLQRRVVQ